MGVGRADSMAVPPCAAGGSAVVARGVRGGVPRQDSMPLGPDRRAESACTSGGCCFVGDESERADVKLSSGCISSLACIQSHGGCRRFRQRDTSITHP